jgi:hypothetical protein
MLVSFILAIRNFYVDGGNATQRIIQNKLDSMILKSDQLVQEFIILLDNQFELLQPQWIDNQKNQLLGRAIVKDVRFGSIKAMVDAQADLTFAEYCNMLITKETNTIANENIQSRFRGIIRITLLMLIMKLIQ